MVPSTSACTGRSSTCALWPSPVPRVGERWRPFKHERLMHTMQQHLGALALIRWVERGRSLVCSTITAPSGNLKALWGS